MTETSRAARRSSGPATDLGKARSSLNGTRHGLRARGVLLQFESEEEYESHIVDIVGALGPVGAAETNLAAEYADIMWVRRRWLIAFTNHLQEQAEAAVAKDPANVSATDCAHALTGIDGLLGILQHAVDAGITSRREMIVAPAKLVFGLIVVSVQRLA